MLAVPATRHGTLLHHAVMLQLSDATRALLLAGDFVVSDKRNKSCKLTIGKEDMEKGLLPNYYMGQVALDYANQLSMP